MRIIDLVSYFFGGSCVVNAVPHLVSGLTGRAFPTLFSKPVGVGLSPPVVNFLWGWANVVFAYLLLCRVGEFEPRSAAHVSAVLAGALFVGVSLARHFGVLFSGHSPTPIPSTPPT